MSTPLMLAESLWANYKSLIDAGAINEIRMPATMMAQLGMEGLSFIGERFRWAAFLPLIGNKDLSTCSKTLQTTAKLLHDSHRGIIRIMAARNLHGHREISEQAHAGLKIARKEKTPRPPNAFILYRQRHHPLFKEACPHLHNNQICKISSFSVRIWSNETSAVIIGKQWTDETNEVKDQYKKAAEEIKEQHLRDHPEYQYRPRKPTEKKRRMTKRKAAALAAQSAKENGQEKVVMDKASSSANYSELDLLSTRTRDSMSPLGGANSATEPLNDAIPRNSNDVAAYKVRPEYTPPKMEFTTEANPVFTLGDDSALPSDFTSLMVDFNANIASAQGPNINAATFRGPILFDNPTEDVQNECSFYTNVEDPFYFPKTGDGFEFDAADATLDNVLSPIPENDIFNEDDFMMSEAESHRILNACANGLE